MKTKIICFFCMISTLSIAQEKHLSSQFNLTVDVLKYESVEYKYNSVSRKFEPVNSNILEFKDGKLTRKIHKENSVLSTLYNSDKKFLYNAKGLTIKIEEDGKIPENYIYDKNDRLIQIRKELKNESPIIQDFAYDSRGNLKSWTKRNGEFIDEEKTIISYSSPNDYLYESRKFNYKSKELLFIEKGEYKGGLNISYQKIITKDGKITNSRLFYDNYKNLIKQTFEDGHSYETLLGYDQKGNVIKERSQSGQELFSQFSKVTFQDGTTTGSTEFAPYFTVGMQIPLLQQSFNKNPKERFKVRKTGSKTFDIQNSKGEIVSIKPSEGLILEEKDFMFYDAKTNEVCILFNLYSNEYATNQWYDLITYNSPTSKYIVVNSDWQFFVLEKAKSIATSSLTLHKGIDENTLVVAENGKEKYFVPYLNQIKPMVIYPLELIAN
ncbi:MAG: hypothetical protein LCH67_19305 [Bacteroidetes bacterium]|nr:hypothetical protein [Bacteroidota bacterium]